MGTFPQTTEERVVALVTVRTRRDAAAVIRAAREDAGLSQGELAERLPLSRDDTVDLESGRGSLYAASPADTARAGRHRDPHLRG